MTHSNQWLQERADLLATVTEWRERAEAAEAKVARLTKAGGDMRLAIAGYINPEEAARRWDSMENTDE